MNSKSAINIFENTNRPDKTLFYKSHDKSDRKFGDTVSSDIEQYTKCEFVIIGCPQDEGVKRNKGRVGAAEAPDKIREVFYKLSAPAALGAGVIMDIGNTKIAGTLEKTHDLHEQIIAKLISDKKKVIVLGGGNDISYPDCKALATNSKSVLAINVDSHFDVRDNTPRNSGTPYRQLLEEKLIKPNNFFELANQPFANSETYRDYLKKKKVSVFTLEQLRKKGISKTIKTILKQNRSSSIFWGLDIDSVRSSDAPGASASYPTGLSAEEILEIAKVAGSDKRSRIIELTEINPKYDIDNRTCRLAALMILSFLNPAG